MTTGQLQVKYAEVFREPTRSYNKQHLVKRIIWKMQANEMGGLSDRRRFVVSWLVHPALPESLASKVLLLSVGR